MRRLMRCGTLSWWIADLPAVLALTYRDYMKRSAGTRCTGSWARRRGAGMCGTGPADRPSHEAARRASAGSPVAADDLFALTSGYRLFVEELLASTQGEHVPRTIVDAVMARVRQLHAPVQDVLEQRPGRGALSALERWLVDVLVPHGPGRVAALAAAEQGGLLSVSARRISFRHELTRRADRELGAIRAADRAESAGAGRPGRAGRVGHIADRPSRRASGRRGRHRGLRPGGRPGRGAGWCPPRGGRPFRSRPRAHRPVHRGGASRPAGRVRD